MTDELENDKNKNSVRKRNFATALLASSVALSPAASLQAQAAAATPAPTAGTPPPASAPAPTVQP